MPQKRAHGAVHPGWKWGPFTARIPIYHTPVQWPELFQGLFIAAATGLALVPLLTTYFGLTFEEAIAASLIHAILINSAPILFGEPYCPGWITPALPFTLLFVIHGTITEPSLRFQAMTALSIDLTIILIVLGVTGLGKRFMLWMPTALKSGIIMGASIAAFLTIFDFKNERNVFLSQPISTTLAVTICLVLTFSQPFRRFMARNKVLAVIASLGLLPGFLVAAFVGPFIGEIKYDIQWGFLLPPLSSLWAKASPFSIGWPDWQLYLQALPLALIGYILIFGDLVTGNEVINDAQAERPDEKIDIDTNRSHYSLGIRNFFMAISAPFFTTQGALWTGVHVVVVQRWKQGRKAMDTLFGGIHSYYVLGIPILYTALPLLTGIKPLMGIALTLTLTLTGFACAYVAMAMVKDSEERGVSLLTGVSLAVFDPWVGLVVGAIATFALVGNQKEPPKKR